MYDRLLLPDADGLRAKIAELCSTDTAWQRRWDRFAREANSGHDRFLHAALMAVVTGEQAWRDRLHAQLSRAKDWYQTLLELGHQDTDPWIHSAKLTRLAIAIDWAWDLEAIEPDLQQELAEMLLRDALTHAYVTMHHRIPPHANNQGLALSLYMVVLGLTFGLRRGEDPIARHLLYTGLHHLPIQVALLPMGGYSGEGSTYLGQVADPLMALTCGVMEQATDVDFFNQALAPTGNHIRGILGLNARLRGVSGLLLPWNQHGLQRTMAGTTAAWWSWRTDDASAYRAFIEADGWELSETFAWFGDDHVWQWVYMPPTVSAEPTSGDHPKEKSNSRSCTKNIPRDPDCWAEPYIAAALRNADRSLQLTQFFNMADPLPVRRHVHPNAIHLEAWDSPLTVDGNSHTGFPLTDRPETQWIRYYGKKPERRSWAAGSIAAHSCVYPEGHEALRPKRVDFNRSPAQAVAGQITDFRTETQGLNQFTVDTTGFYEPAVDAKHVSRTASLVDDALWLVEDRMTCASSHRWVWQLVTRPGLVSTPYGARLTTAEAVVLDLVDLDGAPGKVEDVVGYPTTLEQRCCHYRKLAKGKSVRFLTLLIAQLGRVLIADWSEQWLGGWVDNAEKISPSRNAKDASLIVSPISLADSYDADIPAPEAKTLWMQRSCNAPPSVEGDRVLLELPRAMEYRVWIGDHELGVDPFKTHGKEPRLVAPYLDVTEYLEPAQPNMITLAFPNSAGEPVAGSIRLHRCINPPAPQISCSTQSSINMSNVVVKASGREHQIDLENLRLQDQTTSPQQGFANSTSANPVITCATMESTWRKQLSFSTVQTKASDWEGHVVNRIRACVNTIECPENSQLQYLISFLNDPDPLVQMVAARALGRTCSPRAATALRKKLGREIDAMCNGSKPPPLGCVQVREMCLLSLGELGDPAAASVVARCLHPEEFYGVRRLAAQTLGLLKDPASRVALEPWLNDSDPETAAAAALSLSELSLL